MALVHRKGLQRDGRTPTILYAYGGFNSSVLPEFTPAIVAWMEMGGMYAVANIRGGAEYGDDWHEAGKREKKQNVFDDFIAAAEWLIAQKYTSTPKLAIFGGSNGGLLVGAVTNQRPDLFGAAMPAVGVMDMLRFQKFTIGAAWVDEYGSSDDAAQFKTLRAYSPLHNIRNGVKYPAVFVTTSDHDDRVVPGHSFKYAAALQEAQRSNERPSLIRIETRAGHGAGKPVTKVIDEWADRLAFLSKELGSEGHARAGDETIRDMGLGSCPAFAPALAFGAVAVRGDEDVLHLRGDIRAAGECPSESVRHRRPADRVPVAAAQDVRDAGVLGRWPEDGRALLAHRGGRVGLPRDEQRRGVERQDGQPSRPRPRRRPAS